MLTEIGALVTIVKNLLDGTKTGIDILGRRRSGAQKSVKDLQARISGIAEQLDRCVALSKMLPLWLKDHSEVDLFTEKLSDEDVRLLDSKLRSLIVDSIHDHFSGVFFRMSFGVLPGVDTEMAGFQQRLRALEGQLNGVPPGDAVAWRRSWSVIKVRMSDLRQEAGKIDNLAEQIHAQLIKELRDASAQ